MLPNRRPLPFSLLFSPSPSPPFSSPLSALSSLLYSSLLPSSPLSPPPFSSPLLSSPLLSSPLLTLPFSGSLPSPSPIAISPSLSLITLLYMLHAEGTYQHTNSHTNTQGKNDVRGLNNAALCYSCMHTHTWVLKHTRTHAHKPNRYRHGIDKLFILTHIHSERCHYLSKGKATI